MLCMQEASCDPSNDMGQNITSASELLFLPSCALRLMIQKYCYTFPDLFFFSFPQERVLTDAPNARG